MNPTAVRVPVFYGHSESVAIETRDKVTVAEHVRCWSSRRHRMVDRHEAGGYPTPVTHASGTDAVYAGRIREDLSHPARPEPVDRIGQRAQGRRPECRAAGRAWSPRAALITAVASP